MNPKLFHLQRDRDISGVSGTGRVADGVLWPDGTVSVRWVGERPSTVHWDRLADAEAVHGHGGATRIVWAVQPLPTDGSVREQLLAAVDSTRSQALGYASPEGLLAAYDASRTALADRAALRDRIAEAALAAVEAALGDALVSSARVEALAGIVAVLPATTNHDQGAVAIEHVERTFAAEVNDDRALTLLDALIVLRSKLPCTCARSCGLHETGCRRYVPGHELLSPARRLARAREELRRVADETAPTETIPVETLARLLSDGDVEINHGDYPTYDTLAESGQQQYRQAARYLLKRLHIAERQPAVGARQDGAPRPGLRARHRTAWAALTPEQQAARLAALDVDEELRP